MLRRNWGVLVAVAGLALAGAAPTKEDGVSKDAAAQVGPPAAPTLNYAPHPNVKADNCYQAKDHDAADLCAQWRAALAAEKSANFTWWGNLIGGAAALFSAASVILVIFALRQTEKSLKAARDANSIAREIGEAQTRAHVHIDSAKVGFLGNLLSLDVVYKNTGQSPAHEINGKFLPSVWVNGIYQTEYSHIREMHTAKEMEIDGGSVGASGLSGEHGTVWVIAEESPGIVRLACSKHSSNNFSLIVLIHYTLEWLDVFGSRQTVLGSVGCFEFVGGQALAGEGTTGIGIIKGSAFEAERWLADRKA